VAVLCQRDVGIGSALGLRRGRLCDFDSRNIAKESLSSIPKKGIRGKVTGGFRRKQNSNHKAVPSREKGSQADPGAKKSEQTREPGTLARLTGK